MEARCAMVAPLKALAVESRSASAAALADGLDGVEVARGRLKDIAPFAAARDLSPCSDGDEVSVLREESVRLELKAWVAAEFPWDRSFFCSADERLALKA
jgi:hypothetical protein